MLDAQRSGVPRVGLWGVGCVVLLVAAVSGCAPATPAATTPDTTDQTGALNTEQPVPTDVSRDHDGHAVATTPVCAVAHLGLDLRALPTPTSPNGVDQFVLGQAHELHVIAGAPPLRVTRIPGVGVLHVFFDAATSTDALERCERSITRYLANAPRLPVTWEPAAQLTEPCRACDLTEVGSR